LVFRLKQQTLSVHLVPASEKTWLVPESFWWLPCQTRNWVDNMIFVNFESCTLYNDGGDTTIIHDIFINNAMNMISYSFAIVVYLFVLESSTSAPPCKNDNSFYFNTNPKSIVVREGSRAFLECNVSNLCNVQFHWTIGGDLVANTSRRYQNSSNLIITRVNKSLDSDEFHCIATVASSGFSQQSEGATLSIQCKIAVILY
uniref:Ig-like domain-containing protein n=1 Tax=Romanomermis culicivorax TaxID=13658 RepID=A0A915L5W7_ROMCU